MALSLFIRFLWCGWNWRRGSLVIVYKRQSLKLFLRLGRLRPMTASDELIPVRKQAQSVVEPNVSDSGSVNCVFEFLVGTSEWSLPEATKLPELFRCDGERDLQSDDVGNSTLRSCKGAQIFEAVGLIKKCFKVISVSGSLCLIANLLRVNIE